MQRVNAPLLGDPALAQALAHRTAKLLRRMRHSSALTGKALGDAADAVAQARLAQALATHRPDDAVLSEEAPDSTARLSARRVWIIDPLDGTREYREGRDDWAVHVALTDAGRPVASAVALGSGATHASAQPAPLPALLAMPLRIVVSRSRAPALAHRVAERLGAELVPMGSAGAKAMAVVRGVAHAYLHAGGMNEWDACAPVGVALAAGLHASRLDGSACVFNQPGAAMPDLLICRPECLAALRAAIDAG